jgi:Phospholipase_D-nuclease N-terminal
MRTFWGLSTPAFVALVALGAVQLTLQIIAGIDLAKRSVVPGGRKWVWALVIVVGGLPGAVAYLAIGRSVTGVPTGTGEPQAGGETAARSALDKLYGPDRHP